MAFPTSPSNNDVHKESNRAWVYDSTLTVWNQVPEFDPYPFVEPPNLTNTMPGVISRGIQDHSAFPAGHVLQTVRGTHSTEQYTNTTAYAATGLYASITPATTGNKILIHVNTSMLNSMSGTVGYLTIYANHADGSTMVNIDGTASASSVGYANLHDANASAGTDILVPATMTELHSPGTSGRAIRYEMYARSSTTSQNVHWSQNASRSTIILQEIRA